MKIRTSFVTNSSGSSTSRIVIDNTILIDLIKKYISQESLNYLNNNSSLNIKDCIIDNGSWGEGPTKDIFWGFYSEINELPNKLIESLKREIPSDYVVNEIFDELEREIEQKKELINNSYNITYNNSYSGDMGIIGYTDDEIILSRNNKCPKCNSALIYSQSSMNGYGIRDNYEEEGEVLNISFYCSNKNCDYADTVIEHEEYKIPFKNESIEVRNNKEKALEAVKDDPSNYNYVGRSLKNDRDIALEAIKSVPYSINYASKTLQGSKSFIKEAIKCNRNIYQYLSDEMKKEISLSELNLDIKEEEKNDILKVIKKYAEVDKNDKYICPFCKVGKLSINEENNSYICSYCNKAGDVIQFLLDYDRYGTKSFSINNDLPF